jgi:hypothetical protein
MVISIFKQFVQKKLSSKFIANSAEVRPVISPRFSLLRDESSFNLSSSNGSLKKNTYEKSDSEFEKLEELNQEEKWGVTYIPSTKMSFEQKHAMVDSSLGRHRTEFFIRHHVLNETRGRSPEYDEFKVLNFIKDLSNHGQMLRNRYGTGPSHWTEKQLLCFIKIIYQTFDSTEKVEDFIKKAFGQNDTIAGQITPLVESTLDTYVQEQFAKDGIITVRGADFSSDPQYSKFTLIKHSSYQNQKEFDFIAIDIKTGLAYSMEIFSPVNPPIFHSMNKLALGRGKSALDISNFTLQVSMKDVQTAFLSATDQHLQTRAIRYAKKKGLNVEETKMKVKQLTEEYLAPLKEKKFVSLEEFNKGVFAARLGFKEKAQSHGLKDFHEEVGPVLLIHAGKDSFKENLSISKTPETLFPPSVSAGVARNATVSSSKPLFANNIPKRNGNDVQVPSWIRKVEAKIASNRDLTEVSQKSCRSASEIYSAFESTSWKSPAGQQKIEIYFQAVHGNGKSASEHHQKFIEQLKKDSSTLGEICTTTGTT